MIRAYHFSPATKLTTPLAADALPASTTDISEGHVFWIDLQDPTPEEESRVFEKLLHVHPLTLEDITRMRRLPDQGAHLPKVEEFDDYLFVIVNPLPRELCEPNGAPVKLRRPQLSVILTENLIITHHYEALTCMDAVLRHVQNRSDLVNRGPDFLFHLILDEMVDEYAPVVERMSARLGRVETRIFEKPSRAVLTELLRMKRRVLFLRKTLVLEREVLARLVRSEFSLVTEQEIHYYRNVYDHLVRYTELIENAREMTSDLMQMHLASASNKLNEIMKVLTMISTVILPMTLIVGYYGMNFKHMDELDWASGHWLILGLLGLVALAAFVLFRWKRWL